MRDPERKRAFSPQFRWWCIWKNCSHRTLRATSPEPAGEAKVTEHERLPPRQLRPEARRLAARNPKADRSRDVTVVEATDVALPTPPGHSGETMPRGGGLAGYEVAAHHHFLSSHELPDRTPVGTPDAARRKPPPAREDQLTIIVFSEAKWQHDGRGAAGVTGASQRAPGATDACRRANEAFKPRSVSDEVSTPVSALNHPPT